MTSDLDDALATLLTVGKEAGSVAHERFGAVHAGDVQFKSDVDLVTRTDFDIQALLEKRLRSAFPTAVFVGEEGPESGSDAGPSPAASGNASGDVLLVDPLDGTANFVHGIPYYSISLALLRSGAPVAGVVVAPELQRVYAARLGGGAFCNGERISVSDREPLLSALAATGFAAVRSRLKPDNLGLLRHMAYRVRGLRRFGSAAIDLCYVADGTSDLFWEYGLHDWDIAAGAVIVSEAGGGVSTIAGDQEFLGTGNILATNGRVHKEFLEEASSVAEH